LVTHKQQYPLTFTVVHLEHARGEEVTPKLGQLPENARGGGNYEVDLVPLASLAVVDFKLTHDRDISVACAVRLGSVYWRLRRLRTGSERQIPLRMTKKKQPDSLFSKCPFPVLQIK
jgi:hypothetical protein